MLQWRGDGVASSRGARTPSTRSSRDAWSTLDDVSSTSAPSRGHGYGLRTPPRAVVLPLDRRLGRVVGRRVVGGAPGVGALRVLRVPLEVTGTEQALHRVAALVLAKQLRLAHAGPRTELVALVLGRRRRVVPVAGHLLLDGVLWAVCPPGSRCRSRERAAPGAACSACPAPPNCFLGRARRKSRR